MPKFCPSCEASNPSSSSLCASCGTALEPPSPVPEPPPHPEEENTSREGPAKKPRVKAQVRSGRKAIANVRLAFFIIGLWTLISAAVTGGRLWRGEPTHFDGEYTVVMIDFVFASVVCLLSIAAVCWAARNPLPWAIGAASFLTLQVVAALVMLRFPGLLLILFTIFVWGLIRPIRRLKQIAAQHPDLVSAEMGPPSASARRPNVTGYAPTGRRQ